MHLLSIASIVAAAVVSSVTAQDAVCSPSDFESIKTWMAACDSVTTGSAAKCNNRACHSALHRLEEEETHACWVSFGGAESDFHKYEALDSFCHGEGPDPELPVEGPPSNSTAPPAPSCSIEDGLAIYTWMYACDSVVGDLAAKCANEDCHNALHRLEEEETHECWESLGLGTHEDFEKYEVLDAFCHGEEHEHEH